jgi:hypothetical protein
MFCLFFQQKPIPHYDVHLSNGDDYTTCKPSELTFVADVDVALDHVTDAAALIQALGSFVQQCEQLETSANFKEFPAGLGIFSKFASRRFH